MKLRLYVPAVLLGLALTACAGPADDAVDTGDAAADPTSPSSLAPATSESSESSGTEAPTEPSEAPSESPSEAPPTREPRPEVLAITVSGAEVGPNAEEVRLDVGEPLVLTFDSDRAGELHVHSKPEQYVQFEAGRSEQELVVETPGTVEVEDHDTGAVVAILEVS